jgi:cell division protease FtsH
MADALMKYETIDAGQINAIMEGREPGPPDDWSDDETSTPDEPTGKADVDEDPDLDPAKLH